MAAEWQIDSLSALISVKHGFAFKGDFIHDQPRGDILLTPGNFAIGGGFKGEKFKYYDGPVPEEYVLRAGELLVTMTDLSKEGDTLGYPAFVPASKAGRRFLHNQRLGRIVITAPGLLDQRFLHYLLRTREYREEVLASATGTAIKHTSPSRICRFRFRRPPLLEQRGIAAVLGALDDKIELNRGMNEALEATARATFKDWFVDFGPTRAKVKGREPYLAPDIWELFPSSFNGDGIPLHWRYGTVGAEYDFTMGQSPPGETYTEEPSGLPFYQGRTDFGFRYPTRRVFCTAPTRVAEAGNTLVSVRAPVGDLNMAWEKCCIGRGVAGVRHKSGSRSFTYYSLWSLQTALQAYENSGTVFGAINKQHFAALKIVVPDASMVAKFESTVAPFDERIRANTDESASLSKLRDVLLPRLISGEICLRDAEDLVGAVA